MSVDEEVGGATGRAAKLLKALVGCHYNYYAAMNLIHLYVVDYSFSL